MKSELLSLIRKVAQKITLANTLEFVQILGKVESVNDLYTISTSMRNFTSASKPYSDGSNTTSIETLVSMNFTELASRVVELDVAEEGPSLADEEAWEAGHQAWMEALKMLEILCSAK